MFPGEGHKFVNNQWKSSGSSLPASHDLKIGTTGRKSPYPLQYAGGNDLNIPVQHERSHSSTGFRTPTPNMQNSAQQNGIYSDHNESIVRQRSPAFMQRNAAPNVYKKRYSLPNTQIIDINIDRLHSNNDKLSHNVSFNRSGIAVISKKLALML